MTDQVCVTVSPYDRFHRIGPLVSLLLGQFHRFRRDDRNARRTQYACNFQSGCFISGFKRIEDRIGPSPCHCVGTTSIGHRPTSITRNTGRADALPTSVGIKSETHFDFPLLRRSWLMTMRPRSGA